MSAAKGWIIFMIITITVQSAFAQTPPPTRTPAPPKTEEISVTAKPEVDNWGDFSTFLGWLQSLMSWGAAQEETSVCRDVNVSGTTPRADAGERLFAANAIIQPMYQGPSRASHNGEIIRIVFADGGTEDYRFVAAASSVEQLDGTLDIQNGVAKPC